MPQQPLVSFITPAYNSEKYLGAAISSALSQTYFDIEVIVVDDGSSDRTADIATAYGDPVRVIRQENAGVSAARAAAMRAARGDYFAILDADDVLLPPYLTAMMETLAASKNPKAWVCSEAQLLEPTGLNGNMVIPYGPIPADQQRLSVLQFNIFSIFGVFPRDMYEEIGDFDRELRRCEDWDYWARATFAGWRASYQPKPYALYRRTAGTLSTHSDGMLRAEDAMIANLAARLDGQLTAEERRLIALRDAHGSAARLLRQAEQAVLDHDVPAAQDLYLKASEAFPMDKRLRRKAQLVKRAPQVTWLLRRKLVHSDQR